MQRPSVPILAISAMLLFAGTAIAVPSVEFSFGAVEFRTPDQFDVPILVDTNRDLAGFKFTIEYHSDCFTFQNAYYVGGAFEADSTSWRIPIQTFVETSGVFDNGTSVNRRVIVLLNPQTTTANLPALGGTDQQVIRLRFAEAAMFPPGTPPAPCKLFWDDRNNFGGGSTQIPNTVVLDLDDSEIKATAFSAPSEPCMTSILSGIATYYADAGDEIIDANVCVGMNCDATGPLSMSEAPYSLTISPGCVTVELTATKSSGLDDEDAVGLVDATRCWWHSLALTGQELDSDEKRAGNAAGANCDDGMGSPRPCTDDPSEDDWVDDADCQAIERYILRDRTSAADAGKWRFNFNDNGNLLGRNTVDVDLGVGTTTQDVRGFFLGDINGSWPGVNPNPKPQPPFVADTRLEVVERTGDEIVVALSGVFDQEEYLGARFSLAFSPEELEYLGIYPGAETPSFRAVDYLERPGFLNGMVLGWRGPASNVSGEILTLRFRPLVMNPTTISIVSLSVNDRQVNDLPKLDFGDPSVATPTLPGKYGLSGQPNPFNPTTRIQYTIPAGAQRTAVVLRVFDISGRLVRTLVDEPKGPGFHHVIWDGTDEHGNGAQSGIYFVQALAGEWSQVLKLTLLK